MLHKRINCDGVDALALTFGTRKNSYRICKFAFAAPDLFENFWFIDTLVSKPTTSDGGDTVEDTRDKIYNYSLKSNISAPQLP